MAKKPQIGALKYLVEIYQIDPDNKTTTGETDKLEKYIGKIQSSRIDGTGSETEDDKIYYLQNRIYTIRFVDIVWKKGQEMFIRDEDGDYQIYSIEQIGRKEFLALKTSKIA